MNRRSILESLIRFERTIGQLRSELISLPWDTDLELVTLRRTHLQTVLKRFLTGELSPEIIEEWANMVEGRDDIAFEGGRHGPTAEVVHTLANPLLTQPLTFERAKSLWSRLK